jgi:hypothetical protein
VKVHKSNPSLDKILSRKSLVYREGCAAVVLKHSETSTRELSKFQKICDSDSEYTMVILPGVYYFYTGNPESVLNSCSRWPEPTL